jgi:ribonuclease E
MLINATQEEELRMAMVDGQSLYDLNIELPSGERKKANIYKGQITRIEPSLEAAFVNYGGDRHGFLPLKEISSEYFVADVASGSKPNIREVLKEGQDIVVQIGKEERGNKGAALTTFVSLAGRFIVLKPNKSRSGGVSRRIVGEDRELARQSMHEIEVPQGMSVILRTAGIDRSGEELEWDLQNLLAVWESIKSVVVGRPSPFLIYRESNAIVRALRDYLTNDIGEILVDDEATYAEAKEFVEQVMPHNLRKLKYYSDPVPLFTRYQIESQIESAFAHTVTLPSGGSIVIDHTEALVSIDINSARATKGSDIEATALNTNVEAADEVARQLRLRDLGGLVVIDFIDMGPQPNQREVENRLRDAVRQDRARVQIGKITRFGLLEMSRQRLRPSLGESNHLVCPRCSGIGSIRSVESLALAILRLIGEEARKERTAKVVAQLPVEVATYLLNEKRDWVQNLESRNDTQVILVANLALETPHFQIRRVRDDQLDLPENAGLSYTLPDEPDTDELPAALQESKPMEPAAVATPTPTTPAPPPKTARPKGLWARIVNMFSGSMTDKKEKGRKRGGDRRPARGKSDSRRRGGQRKRRQSEGSRSNENRGAQRTKKSSAKRTKSGAAKNAERKEKTSRDNERPEKQARDSQVDNPDNKGGDNRNETRKAGGKRRSRGGRRRRRSPDSSAAATTRTDDQQAPDEAVAQAPLDAPAAAAQPAAEKPSRSRSRGSKEESKPAHAAAQVEDARPDDSSVAEDKVARDSQPQAVEVKEDKNVPTTQPQEAAPRQNNSVQDAQPQAAAVQDHEPEKPQRPEAGSASEPEPAPVAAAKETEAPKAEQLQKPAADEQKSEIESRPAAPERNPADSAPDVRPPATEQQQPEAPAPSMPPPDRQSADQAESPVAASANKAGDEKPEGRLLPWEPAAPAEGTDKTDGELADR